MKPTELLAHVRALKAEDKIDLPCPQDFRIDQL
jgi:hypothetical protein